MSTPTVPVVSAAWLGDPIAIRVGPSTVAIVLVLAARALADREVVDEPVVIALDVWSCYLDGTETDRVVAAGLVEPLLVGGRPIAFRIAPWVRSRIDSERAIKVRNQTRDRVRRLRQKRSDQLKLDLWETCAELPIVPDPDASVTCVTTEPTSDPTTLVPRTYVRTTTSGDRRSVQAAYTQSGVLRRTSEPVENSDKRKTFGRLLAVVARVRQTRWSWTHPTSSTDRRDLLDAVRLTMDRAHLPTPTDQEIRRAIRIVEGSVAVPQPSTRNGDAS